MSDVLTIGEVLWDLFPDGARLGGAPFNLAYHARQLGVDAGCVSSVGDDPLGHDIIAESRRLGLPCDLIQVNETLPTGTVAVDLDPEGKPTFKIAELVAWDAITLTPEIVERLPAARALAFGSLAQRSPASRETIREVVAESRATWKLCDINLRPPFFGEEVVRYCLGAATILKLNDGELARIAAMLKLPAAEDEACRALRRDFGIELLLVTKGDQGCALHGADGTHTVPGLRVKVADTVGSGDAFSAAFLVKLLAGEAPEAACEFANAVGALVASKPGATPPITAREVHDMLRSHR